jgi:hypothetical protein
LDHASVAEGIPNCQRTLVSLLSRTGPVRRRGDTLRNAGLPSERIRRPDTRPTGLAGECADQSRLIRGAETPESRAEDEDWFDASDRTGWTA